MNEQQTTPTPNDGTPTTDPAAALHWAAVAHGLAETRTLQGNPLTADERVDYDRYQNAAHAHGFTDEQIRDHMQTLGRPQ
ncbi:hypothetical protein [Streptomyces sp. NPDC088812]|uniref:hypothetical protein n=1 Tax=Streptomyces sp. NPDC088812 TaxID=3365905 RepID=UPI0037F37941